MTDDGLAHGRDQWRLTEAIIAVEARGRGERTAGTPEVDGVRLQLWESHRRAFFASRTRDGALIRESSAGPGYYREHDHLAQHQVIRDSFDLDRGLALVRGAFGWSGGEARYPTSTGWSLEASDAGFPTQLDADGLLVRWEYTSVRMLSVRRPEISRRRGYTWELYMGRQLRHLADRILRAPLPMSFGWDSQFDEGFLYANSWHRGVQAHLVWSVEGGELELVVADRDDSADLSALDTVVSRTGPTRIAVVRGPTPEAVDAAVRSLDLDSVIAASTPMPRVEDSIGRYRLRAVVGR